MKIQRSSLRRTTELRPLKYVIFLLFSTSVVLFLQSAQYQQQEDDGRNVRSSSTSLLVSSASQASLIKQYPAVNCPVQIQTRNQKDYGDPNEQMVESPKRLTTTNPNFWISLHKEHFDKMRWASIMVKGNYYETGVTDQFHQILVDQPPGLVIDIGMNIGWFSLFARAHKHTVVAFEPNPIMHTRVCESLVLNQWDTNDATSTSDGDNDSQSPTFQIFPYGLGTQPATLNLTMGKNPGSSSFHEERLAKAYRRKIEVKVTTLDDMALQEGWIPGGLKTHQSVDVPIHLMKVDVEGYEPQVFGGGQRLLKSGRIQNIIMEHSITDLRESTDLLATISQAGYKVHYLSTVLGDAYHPEMLSAINQALETAVPGMSLDGLAEPLVFLAKVTCNLWWAKRDE